MENVAASSTRDGKTSSEAPGVLVADDDLMIRKMVGMVLERQGFAVEFAKDGAEAIEKCHERRYAVILLDLMMPRIDGMKVLEWLKEHRPDLMSHVVVMTAFPRAAGERAEQQCKVIYKPFDLDHLVECVRSTAKPEPPQ